MPTSSWSSRVLESKGAGPGHSSSGTSLSAHPGGISSSSGDSVRSPASPPLRSWPRPIRRSWALILSPRLPTRTTGRLPPPMRAGPTSALAVLLGSSFNAQGRFDRGRFAFDLTELPLSFESTDDGGTRLKPCAEVLLGTRAADRLLGAGLMPFQSIRNHDAIRLAQLVSIADPPAPLAIP